MRYNPCYACAHRKVLCSCTAWPCDFDDRFYSGSTKMYLVVRTSFIKFIICMEKCKQTWHCTVSVILWLLYPVNITRTLYLFWTELGKVLVVTWRENDCCWIGWQVLYLGPVVRRSDSAIHRIVIFSTFVKCLKNCETTDIDDIRSIKNILTYKY